MLKCKFLRKSLSLFLMLAMLCGMVVGLSASGGASPDPVPPAEPIFPWYDTSLTFAERATALVAAMTNAEKASQITTGAAAIPRLDVRAYDWWREAITGVQGVEAVSFPTSIAMSLTWDTNLREESASVIGAEARAWFTSQFRWLGQYCPTLNVGRDPRWGRSDEGHGEDPYLVGEMGVAYVRGFQGENEPEVNPDQDPRYYTVNEHGERYVKAMATPKHFAANNDEGTRNSGTANMSDKILREFYLPHFREVALRTSPSTYMTAYNRVNWVPAYAHTYLNNTLLRKTWGFDGFVVSDCGGMNNLVTNHRFAPSDDKIYGLTHPDIVEAYRDGSTGANNTVNLQQAVAFSLMGGTDMSCTSAGTSSIGVYGDYWLRDGWGGNEYANNIPAAINNGTVTDNGVINWDDVDRALVRAFTQRIATGEFDLNPGLTTVTVPGLTARPAPDLLNYNSDRKWDVGGLYGTYNLKDTLQTPEHIDKTLEASRKSIVMLKNDKVSKEPGAKNILPLDIKTSVNAGGKVGSIAVVGRLNDVVEMGAANYTASPRLSDRTSFRQGLDNALIDMGYTGTVKYYTPAANTPVQGNLFNLKDFKLTANVAGTNTDFEINAGDADVVSGCVANGGIIQNITDGSYAVYNVPAGALSGGGLIINGFEIAVSTAGLTPNDTLPIVEVRRGGNDGELLGTIIAKRTADLATYAVSAGVFDEVTLHGENYNKICLVFTTNKSVTNGFTPVDLAEIIASDAVIYYAGSSSAVGLGVGNEGSDRGNMNLPGTQAAEIRQLQIAGANLIMPIQASGMMNITDLEPGAKAILFTGYNGQKQGQALAETLLGINNPSGHLSFTWYANEAQLGHIRDYEIQPGMHDGRWAAINNSNPSLSGIGAGYGRSYQYFTGDILYPFGYGLSYAEFVYSSPALSKSTVTTAEEFTLTVDVENTSNVSGTEVVQVYLVSPGAGECEDPGCDAVCTCGALHGVGCEGATDCDGVIKVPFRQLKGFKRVDIPAKTKITVEIPLDSDDFWFIEEVPYTTTASDGSDVTNDTSGKRVVYEGDYTLEVASFADRDEEDANKFELPLTIDGVVDPWLQTVTFMADKIVVTPTQVATPELSVALSDETLFDEKTNPDGSKPPKIGDLPGFTVTYSSDSPLVNVNPTTGVISLAPGAAKGTAIIKVEVTYDGKTLENTYAVVTDPGAGAHNTTMASFAYEGITYTPADGVTTYDVNVSKLDSKVNFTTANVTASYPDDVYVSVKLNPSNGAVSPGKPCVATVRIVSEADLTNVTEMTYTINFGHMEAKWDTNVNNDEIESYMNVRFSDGETGINAFLGWYDKASGVMKHVDHEWLEPVPKNGTARVHIKTPVDKVTGAVGNAITQEELDGLMLKRFAWDQNMVPIAPASTLVWEEKVPVWRRVTNVADITADAEYIFVRVNRATAMTNNQGAQSGVPGLARGTLLEIEGDYIVGNVSDNIIWQATASGQGLKFANKAGGGAVPADQYLALRDTTEGSSAGNRALGGHATDNITWTFIANTGNNGNFVIKNAAGNFIINNNEAMTCVARYTGTAAITDSSQNTYAKRVYKLEYVYGQVITE